jgi:hypothetical protein
LREDQARDASEGKLADLNMAWTLTFPPRDRSQHIDRRIAGTSRHDGPYDGRAG